MLRNSGQVSKFLVSVLGTVTTGISTFYGTARWEPVAVMGLTALAVYLVPNQQNGPHA